MRVNLPAAKPFLWNQFLVVFLVVLVATSGMAHAFEYLVHEGKNSGIAEKSIVILGERDAVLIDAQWMLVDGAELAERIAETGRNLTHILLTHGHPDHYMGMAPIIEKFPQAKVLARAAVREEIEYQYPAKFIHWHQLMGDQLPVTPVLPEVFAGDVTMLEGTEIRWIDMPPAETMDATVFWIPADGALIPGDVVFAKTHAYFADLNHPNGWIKALEQLQRLKGIKTVYPGHGPVGGPEVLVEALRYMRHYADIAKPGVTLPTVADAMVSAFPDYEAELLLWWTRGPGFGVFGPRALGVPDNVLAQLPPPLSYPGGCPASHRELIDTLFHRGFTGANMTVLDEVFSPNIEFTDPNFPAGLAGIKALVAKNNASFKGWRFELDQVLCDGNQVTVRWRGMGQHVASFMGEAVTNNDVTLSGISIYTVEDGRVTADYVIPDNLGFLSQIEVIKPQDMTRDAQ